MTTPFYGADDAALFAVGRLGPGPPGRVIAELDQRLPDGLVLDVRAGDGFLAQALTTRTRTVLPVTATSGERRPAGPPPAVLAHAHELPFGTGVVAGACAALVNASDARGFEPTVLLAELHRTVRRGGPLVVVARFGANGPAEAIDPWTSSGFECEVVDTTLSSEQPLRYGVLTAPSRGR